MIALELHQRVLENKDWATVLFLVSIALIVVAKTTFEARFYDYIRLIVSDKYIKVYKDTGHLMSWFNIFLFIVNLISFSFFIQIILHYYGYGEKFDWVIFVRIFTLLAVFVLSKFVFEKIIATIFGIEELIEHFNLQKVSFRTYIGLLLLPVSILLFYNDLLNNSILLTIIIALLLLNLLTYLFSLRNYQNLIFSKLFYFILYLCALEIAPYYFIYYLVTKN